MKTYKTYQEAKIANPNCEAFTAVTKPFFELQKELEAGELYVKYGSDGMFVRQVAFRSYLLRMKTATCTTNPNRSQQTGAMRL